MRDRSLPSPGWIKEDGPSSDVVLFTRACLSRNLSSFPFIPSITEDTLAAVAVKIEEALHKAGIEDSFTQFDIEHLRDTEIRYFEEDGTVPEDSPREQRFVYISDEGRLVLTVNLGDHLRIESRRGGLRIEECLQMIHSIDLQLETILDYAFSLEWGYLTSRIEAAGSGLSIKFILHLPGLVKKKELEAVQQTVGDEGFLLRPLFLSTSADNGNVALGDLYLLESVRLSGKTEEEVSKKLEEKVSSLVHYEREKRQMLFKEKGVDLEDRVNRAFGILEHAKVLQLEETLEMLSLVRLGCYGGIVSPAFKGVTASLMIESCPAHVFMRTASAAKGGMPQDEQIQENKERANYVNYSLHSVNGRERV